MTATPAGDLWLRLSPLLTGPRTYPSPFDLETTSSAHLPRKTEHRAAPSCEKRPQPAAAFRAGDAISETRFWTDGRTDAVAAAWAQRAPRGHHGRCRGRGLARQGPVSGREREPRFPPDRPLLVSPVVCGGRSAEDRSKFPLEAEKTGEEAPER